MCAECAHTLTVTLTMEQWDQPPPNCPRCIAYELPEPMQQEFKPVAIGGSKRAKAVKLAETIAEQDYNVADMQIEGKQGVRNKVRYKDSNPAPSSWGVTGEALASAVAAGREVRMQHGSALDVIKTMPDLVAESKKRALRM